MTSERVLRQVDRLLTEAEDAMAAGDWGAVRFRAEAVLRLHPGHEDALAYLRAAEQDPELETLRSGSEPERPAERRLMAVMFCDLRGSTELSERLDPEDLRDLLRAYHRAAADVVDRLGGYIARYMGDGLLVYFGFPIAHEDDADRAIRAGLEIVAAAEALPPLPHGGAPEVRVGIHHGLSVIAEMGGGSRLEPHDVVGSTANVAARIQAFASPSTVVVSGELAALLRYPHQMTRLGSHQLKGLSRPIELFRIDGTGVGPEPASPGEGPFIGRARELGIIRTAWENALAGGGGTVLVSGEPGLGKTRLASELRRRVRADGHTVIQLRGSPFHQNTAFRPVVDHLSRVFRLEPGIPRDRVLHRIERSLAGVRLEGRSLVPPLMALLDVQSHEDDAATKLSGPELKEAILDALATWLGAVVARGPTLLTVEDVHWLDPSSLELLLRVAGEAAGRRMLLLLTSRPGPGEVPGIAGGIVRLELDRLDPRTTLDLVGALAEGGGLGHEELQQLAERSDGVPLFAEQLVRAVLEGDGDGQRTGSVLGGDSSVPAALFSSLMARLDRMGPAREVARVAAACGREFTVPLVAAAASASEAEVRTGLSRLTEAGICMPLPQAESYTFKHALILDVAYESMLRADRVELHRTIADVIEHSFPSVCEREPEVLAHHFERASVPERAITYLRRAAARSISQSANQEAINHLSRALDLLETGPGAAARELELRNEIGPPLIARFGYSSPAVEANYRRALEVSRHLADPEQSFRALSGLRRFHQVHGDVGRARSISEELLSLAVQAGSSVLEGIARHALGEALFLAGEPRAAGSELESARDLLDRCRDEGIAAAMDPSVTVRAYLGLTYWMLGYPDRALDSVSAAVSMAEALESPFARAYALVLSAWIHELRREPREAIRDSRAGRAVAVEHHFPYWVHGADVYGAWAKAMEGDSAGLGEFIHGLEGFRSLGARTTEAHLLSLLAEMRAAHEGAARALAAVEEGFAAVGESGERCWLPDLHRLRAVLRFELSPGDPGSSLEDLGTALEIARAAGARGPELRAAVALADLCSRLDQSETRGLEVLREAIDAFPEKGPSPELAAACDVLARIVAKQNRNEVNE